MRCTACGAEQHDSARFCGACGAPLIRRCPRCDADAPFDLRFCTSCGASLREAGDDQGAPIPVAERRRVSVVFLDLEHFTSLAETLDPEEVRALQSRYFEAERSVIAGFGGTVEKFIGDAIVAIWGAPAAHEDDPQRAVAAALAMVRAVGRLGGSAARHRLAGRASVTTGEAAVAVGAVNQGIVAGDLVNVAARLQALAPTGGVLVDETTRELAPAAALYEPVGSLELKGRSAPVSAHVARPPPEAAPASPPTDAGHGGPFVGREAELRELLELHDGVVRDGLSRLVSISGIAGIGKSRLAWELRAELDRRPGLVAWHAGRAPAYGEGITFAAVADMVRQRIRAPAGSEPHLAGRQLAMALSELVRDDAERRWLEPRLAALLGEERLDAFERDDLFAAWRRFFERVAEIHPAVLVFEDLQWADPALLVFIEHLARWARSHPILIVALTRPELYDRHATWGQGAARLTAMHLEPLSDHAIRALLAARAPELDPETVDRIVRHAGGVPLYAVEAARSAADAFRVPERRRGERAPASRPVGGVPPSLHGLIAARIDALPAPERSVLLAAAVLGRRFPLDGLMAVVDPPATVRDSVAELARRELLTLAGGGNEPARNMFAFVQEMVREVAYQTLSREARRRLHLAAARWLESSAEEDAAEALAGHLSAAHDLAPDHPDAPRVARRAVSALRRAAAAAVARHVPRQAVGHLERALRLTDSDAQRAVVLDEAASAAVADGQLELAERHLRELAEHQVATGHRRAGARTRARLAGVLLTAQRNEPAVRELETALRAVRDIGRDAAGVELAAQVARARMLLGDDEAGLKWARRGLNAAQRLGLDAVAADLLVTQGTARVNLGDPAGMDDLRRAVDEARGAGSTATELRAMNNIAWLQAADDPRATLDTAREALSLATTLGVGELVGQLAEVACAAALEGGNWEWALGTIEELDHPGTPIANRVNLAALAAILHALRGSPDPMAVVEALEPLPDDLDPQVTAGVRLARGWAAFVAGRLRDAAEEADAAAAGLAGIERFQASVLFGRARLWSGEPEGVAERLAAAADPGLRGRATDAHVATIRAGLLALTDAAAGRDAYRQAADAWRSLQLGGDVAVCLVDAARLTGSEPDAEALALLDRLGADGLRRLVEGRIAPSG